MENQNQEFNMPSQTPPQPTSSKNTLAIIIVVFVSVLITGGIVYYLQEKKIEKVRMELEDQIIEMSQMKQESQETEASAAVSKIDSEADTSEIEREDENDETISKEKSEIIERETITNTQCSEENPPRAEVNPNYQFVKLLNKCGEETGYEAYEFEDENFILFVESIKDEKKQKINNTLKVISTEAPFEETALTDDQYPFSMLEIQNIIKSGGKQYYINSGFGGSPGVVRDDNYKASAGSIYIFEPKNKDFVYFQKLEIDKSSAGQRYQMFIGSSASGGETITVGIEDEAFKCSSRNVISLTANINEYINVFPEKMPCFNDSDEVIGYYDFIENELVEE